MISRKIVVCGIALLGLFHAAAASAQPRWGRERLPSAGACFYEHIDFGGRYFCTRPGERLSSLPGGMGDEISSVRIFGSGEVIVFKDKNMHGRSARFATDVRDLRRGGWNDQISSIEVGHGAGGGGGDRGDNGWHGDRPPVWGRGPIPRQGACFYEDADYHGSYFCMPRGGDYRSMPSGFNDRISSIRVFSSGVRIYQDRDFHGRSTEIRHDMNNLRGNWRDTVSSIRVF